jgi:transposase
MNETVISTGILQKKMASLEVEVVALRAENAELKSLNNWLQEQFKLAHHRKFGQSSESFPSTEQVSLFGDNTFNETEITADSKPEPELEKIKEHYRKKRTREESLPENIPVVKVLHPLDNGEKICPKCGGMMHVCGHETRDELVVIPARIEIRRHITETASCRECEQTAADEPVPMVKSKFPLFPIPGSYASAEIIAYICCQKFVMGVPLYRQEQDWARRDVLLPRQTMSNWQMKCAELYFIPLANYLFEILKKQKIIHGDETPLKVLKPPHGKPKKAKGKSYLCYMWHYGSGRNAERQIAIYKFHAGRGGENPRNDLAQYSGYLHCDGYQVYHKLPDAITIVGCWVHARRKFADIVKITKDGERANGVPMQAIRRIDKLFKLESEWSSENRPQAMVYGFRQTIAKPLVDEYFTWLNGLNVLPKSALGQAVAYSLNQRKYLENYLRDGRLEASNNRAERAIKPFVIDRKNFLFSNTENGAAASAAVFSLIETAKANEIDPFKYLTNVLQTAPALDLSDIAQLEKLLPWNV